MPELYSPWTDHKENTQWRHHRNGPQRNRFHCCMVAHCCVFIRCHSNGCQHMPYCLQHAWHNIYRQSTNICWLIYKFINRESNFIFLRSTNTYILSKQSLFKIPLFKFWIVHGRSWCETELFQWLQNFMILSQKL
jgi:hypothetical protein